jgi:hypothetical protein
VGFREPSPPMDERREWTTTRRALRGLAQTIANRVLR